MAFAACLTALGTSASTASAQGLWRGVPLAFPRRDHTATLLPGEKVVLVGGNPCRGPDLVGSPTAEIFDVAKMTSAPLPDLKAPRRQHTASLLPGGRLVVVGGVVPSAYSGPLGATDSVEVLNVRAGSLSWQEGPKLLHARRAHAAVVLGDGRLVIIGGYGEHEVPLASVEIWDPRKDRGKDGWKDGWKDGPALREASPGARAHLLRDGRVLVLSSNDHAEVWNPSSAQGWRPVTAPGLRDPLDHPLTTIELPNGKVLAVGQKAGSHGGPASVETWDPKAGSWTVVATIADASARVASKPWSLSAALGDALVLVGQQTAQALSPPSSTLRLLEPPLLPVEGAALTALPSGRLVLTGGHEGHCDLAEVWDPRERPLGRWSPAGNRQEPLNEPLVVLESGQVLTLSPPDPMHPERSRQTRLWDPKTGKVGEPAAMAEARTGFTATPLPHDQVVVTGGVNPGKESGDSLVGRSHRDAIDPAMLRSTEIYSAATNRWTAGPALNEARESHTAILDGAGRVLIFGGTYIVDTCTPDISGYHCWPQSGYDRTSEEAWQPGARSWKIVTPRSGVQPGGVVVRLDDGRVFSAGGDPDGTRAMILDPGSGRWTATASMAAPRFEPAGAALADARVLVAGGTWAEGGTPRAAGERAEMLASAEVWSARSGQWTATRALNVPAYEPSAVRLPDGRVMVVGRLSPRNRVLLRPEIWDPRDGRWTPTAAKPEDRCDGPPLVLESGEVLSCRHLWSPN